LVVEGEGAEGTVTVNGTTFTISDTTENIYIDCEEMNCRNSSGSNRNSLVSSSTSEFATLAPGANSISFSGGVSVVQVTPRWWEL
jgi:phage-related protein